MSSSPSSDSSSLTLSSFDELTEKVGDLLITSTLPSNLSDCSAPSTSSGRSQSAVSSGVESASDYYDILLDLDVVMRAAFRVPSDWRTKYSHLVEVVRQDTQFQKCLAAFRHLKETVDEDKNIGLLQEMSSCVGRVVAHNADISLTPPGSQIAVAGAFDPLFQAAGVNLKVYDLRSHRAVVSLKGNNLRLIYHDHSAMVFSRWFSIVDTDDIDIFIAMLIGYNSLSDAERRPNGFVTILDPEQQEEFICNVQSVTASQRDVFSGLKIHLEREGRTIIVDVEHVIFRDEQLEGRSTCVLAATSEEWPNKQLAVKLCWQGAGRRRDEEEYIRAARDKAEEIGDHWVIDHLPDILHTQDIVLEGDATEERLTQFFRDECDVPKGFVYHPRHLRVIVSELLFPITSLSSETEVAQVFVLAIQCTSSLPLCCCC
ncbi:hypothetical protein CPB85DRAFT_822101 [Mucidula mucida]|nr:hypothetical protein CPB85DRAFT_822101 [Mucidula mucida]